MLKTKNRGFTSVRKKMKSMFFFAYDLKFHFYGKHRRNVMNKAFKAIWSDVRQSFVTTSEIQSSHGKRSKASVSLSVATVLLATSGLVSAAYVETGTLGDKASWETAEYNYNWEAGSNECFFGVCPSGATHEFIC